MRNDRLFGNFGELTKELLGHQVHRFIWSDERLKIDIGERLCDQTNKASLVKLGIALIELEGL